MEVKIQLNWSLSKYLKNIASEGMTLVLPEEFSIGEMMKSLGIPLEEVGLIAVNGALEKTDRILHDQDDVQLYPPLEGG